MKSILAFCLIYCAVAAGAAEDQPPPVVGHVLRPEVREPTPDRIAGLKLPPGFKINIFHRGLKSPRIMRVAPDGRVFVSLPDAGEVVALFDHDKNGEADEELVAMRGLKGVHGIAIHAGKLYAVTIKELHTGKIEKDGSVHVTKKLMEDLPDGGEHPQRTIGFGPDGMLYISVGSTCNACDEPNDEHAALLQAKPGSAERKVFATGLRHTIGFAWHPKTGELWGMDDGIDWLGDDQPPEELNRIQAEKNYGWPFAFGDREINTSVEDPKDTSKKLFADASEPAVLTYTPHASPYELAFYTGAQFPKDYEGDAFVAMHGSWNREEPSGYEVVRIKFVDGQPAAFQPFLSGFLIENGAAQFGRPAGLAIAKDGALLISDAANGIIYRVSYSGEEAKRAKK